MLLGSSCRWTCRKVAWPPWNSERTSRPTKIYQSEIIIIQRAKTILLLPEAREGLIARETQVQSFEQQDAIHLSVIHTRSIHLNKGFRAVSQSDRSLDQALEAIINFRNEPKRNETILFIILSDLSISIFLSAFLVLLAAILHHGLRQCDSEVSSRRLVGRYLFATWDSELHRLYPTTSTTTSLLHIESIWPFLHDWQYSFSQSNPLWSRIMAPSPQCRLARIRTRLGQRIWRRRWWRLLLLLVWMAGRQWRDQWRFGVSPGGFLFEDWRRTFDSRKLSNVRFRRGVSIQFPVSICPTARVEYGVEL